MAFYSLIGPFNAGEPPQVQLNSSALFMCKSKTPLCYYAAQKELN